MSWVPPLFRPSTARPSRSFFRQVGGFKRPIRGFARGQFRSGRDVKAVHADITALINAGMIDRTEEGVSFPYDRIRLDVDIGVAG